jgi:octaprenyl-diphosphate synthase
MGQTTLGAAVPSSDLKIANLLKLLDPIAADLQRVEQVLVEQVNGFESHIREPIRYMLTGSGKRLRPALALLAGGATGRITENHIRIGAVVELIHLATLVHDDVLDEADLRHGQPTAHARWGNAISVLLGDCLFARALHLTATHTNTDICCRVSGAANTVCAGEILQNQRSFDCNLSLEQYFEMINMKTGALFAVSCELGALLNGAASSVVEQMRQFGSHLGIAYQIYDDCVDIFGQEGQAGKSLGTDMKKGKLTLPLLFLLEHAEPVRRKELGDVIFHGTASDQRQLVNLALSNGVVRESQLTIDRYVQQARAGLTALSGNDCSRALAGLLDFIAIKSNALLKEAVAA